VIALPAGSDPSDTIHTVLGERRIFIEWDLGSDTDLAGFNIYVGGVLDGTVETPICHHRTAAAPDSGTGTGTITTSGAYNGDLARDRWTILILSGSRFTFTGTNGTYTAPLTTGVFFSLEYGVSVVFNSSAASYKENDTWNIEIAPKTHYLTQEIESETWPALTSTTVASLDEAGNVSSQSTALPVTVAPVPL
jgi:hypothetical protein